MTAEQTLRLDGAGWRLARDPANIGRQEEWWREPRTDAARVCVPGLIQDRFPEYRGVVWYWTEFQAASNPHPGGRYLLRFREIDYYAEVWVNGRTIGAHEGAQEPFTLDATAAVRPGGTNLMAVRLLHPSDVPIDGMTFNETPHGLACAMPVGGIMDSVELLLIPPVQVEDLFVWPDWQTGRILVQARIRNFGTVECSVRLLATVAPAASGDAVAAQRWERVLPAGESQLEFTLSVNQPRLWQLNDPFLYRITLQADVDDGSPSELSARCGFRDFRFADGYFRLNGTRIFLKNAHHGATAPAWGLIPHGPDLLRRDLLNMKSMGFNMVRFIARAAPPYLLDLADEIGLMVYEECYCAWWFANSPKMPERFDRALSAMIRRDRNHPSVVIWGLLNETRDEEICRHAVESLPMVRQLDPDRMVMLHSGRFDSAGNCINGLQIRNSPGRPQASAIYNPKPYAVAFPTLWPSWSLSLHPGAEGEYAVARFTAPRAGSYRVQVAFRGTAPFATTDVHVLHNGRKLYTGFINLHGRGDRCEHAGKVVLRAGDTVDFVVGWGDGYDYPGWRAHGGGSKKHAFKWAIWDRTNTWVDNTQVEARIEDGSGTVFDAAVAFSAKRQPAGPWSYGFLPPGPVPQAVNFELFSECRTENEPVTGGLSNPGATEWQDLVSDQHHYPRVPHRALDIERLRTITGNDKPLYLAEYGIGSGVDFPRLLRHYERIGQADCYDARSLKKLETHFMRDWQAWTLDDTFAGPGDFLKQSLSSMAAQRKLGINALRSNPFIAGYSLTMAYDGLTYGEGVTTAFREPKPGAYDAIFDGFYPLRWCLFAEPVHVYSGASVRLEAVLANEDQLPAGKYPVRLRVVGPGNRIVLDERLTVKIPKTVAGREPSFVIPVFKRDVLVSGPTGTYRFLAEFEKGAAATGEEIVFQVMNRDDMPQVKAPIALWGEDPELKAWLVENKIRTKAFDPAAAERGGVILAVATPSGKTEAEWDKLTAVIKRGATAIFLDPGIFAKGDQTLGWLPLKTKGETHRTYEYTHPQLYCKDDWAKTHPIFEGLPAGGLMDKEFYREILPDVRFHGLDAPDEAVAGSIRTAQGMPAYKAELMVAVYRLGKGRMILNALRIRQTLGADPVAERLLRNMINYAGSKLRPFHPSSGVRRQETGDRGQGTGIRKAQIDKRKRTKR